MSVAKVSELISESSKSFEDALLKGIDRANKTLRHLTGAWVEEQKVVIDKGKITKYRIFLKVTYVLDD